MHTVDVMSLCVNHGLVEDGQLVNIYEHVCWSSRQSVFLCRQVQLSQLADLDCDLTQYVDLICGKSVHM